MAERTEAWAVGVLGGTALAGGDGPLLFAAEDAAFRRQVTGALSAAGFPTRAARDTAAVEPAAVAQVRVAS